MSTFSNHIPPHPREGVSRNEEGSALITVLVLIAIASTLVGLVLGLASLRHTYVQRDVHRLQARYAAESGVYQALNQLGPSLREMNDVLDVSIGAEATVPCSVSVHPYGGFARVRASAAVQGERWGLEALAGRQAPRDVRHALVFGDDRSSLTLTGTTQLIGPHRAGSRGIETSPLRGERFTGRIDGKLDRDAQVTLPDFNDDALQETLRRMREHVRIPPPGAAEAWEAPDAAPRIRGRRTLYVNGDLTLSTGDSLITSHPTLILATGSVTLDGRLPLADGTIIVAGNTLSVTGGVRGTNALLVGEEGIFVGGNPKLSAQLLSQKQVFVGGSAHLTYPSLLYVASEEGRIFVNAQAQVDGWVLFPNRPGGRANRDPEVRLADSTLVRGAVYNTGMTEFHGTVHGTVLARRFGFYRSPTHYVNWVKDAVFDVTQRPDGFLAPYGFDGVDARPRVLAWRERVRPSGPLPDGSATSRAPAFGSPSDAPSPLSSSPERSP